MAVIPLPDEREPRGFETLSKGVRISILGNIMTLWEAQELFHKLEALLSQYGL